MRRLSQRQCRHSLPQSAHHLNSKGPPLLNSCIPRTRQLSSVQLPIGEWPRSTVIPRLGGLHAMGIHQNRKNAGLDVSMSATLGDPRSLLFLSALAPTPPRQKWYHLTSPAGIPRRRSKSTDVWRAGWDRTNILLSATLRVRRPVLARRRLIGFSLASLTSSIHLFNLLRPYCIGARGWN